MNLTLFIGDILVGIVVVVIGLILLWSVLSSSTDACKLAAGIASDVISISSSEFSVQGSSQVLYSGPDFCRVNEPPLPLLSCSPTKGWNPNITSISLSPYYEDGYFGFDEGVPIAQKVTVGVKWEDNNNNVYKKNLQIFGLLVMSPGMDRQTSYSILPEPSQELKKSNSIVISKESTVFGDTLSSEFLVDPIGSSNGLVNTILQLKSECSKNNQNPYRDVIYSMPNSYQIAWDGSNLCIYKLVLNSHLMTIHDLREGTSEYMSLISSSYNYLHNQGVYSSLQTNVGAIDFVVNKTLTKYTIFTKDGMGYRLVTGVPSSDGSTAMYGLLSNNTCYLPIFIYPNNAFECPTNVNCKSGPCDQYQYDPYDQSNLERYHTGWLKLRCFDFSDIGSDFGIKNFGITFNVTPLKSKIIYASDGMHHYVMDYNSYYSIKNWRFFVSYNCTTNQTTIKFLGVS